MSVTYKSRISALLLLPVLLVAPVWWYSGGSFAESGTPGDASTSTVVGVVKDTESGRPIEESHAIWRGTVGVSGSHDRSLWGELLRPTAKYPVLLQEKRDGVVHLWVANQVLVSLNKGVFPEVLEQAFIDDPVFALRWLNDTSAVVSWDLTEAEEFSITMAAIEGKLGVLATVEPDSIWTVSAMPTDPLLWQQDYFARVGAQEGWAKRAHASGIVIALLDTGIQLDHPDLASAVAVNTAEVPNTGRDDDGNGKVDDVLGWDFVQNNNWPNDLNGHGTNMAGVIAAAWNDVGIAGIANGALIVPIRFMDARAEGIQGYSCEWGHPECALEYHNLLS